MNSFKKEDVDLQIKKIIVIKYRVTKVKKMKLDHIRIFKYHFIGYHYFISYIICQQKELGVRGTVSQRCNTFKKKLM